jgi:hypothetical protein
MTFVGFRRRSRSGACSESAPVLHPDAAGIDVGASELYVAVSADRDPHSVRSFPTFTRDLHALADWLVQCGIRPVAMESTSVYWIPVYQILEARSLEVYLVNAQHVKNVPRAGRPMCQIASGSSTCTRLAFYAPVFGRRDSSVPYDLFGDTEAA